jgi:hypothetical protein
MPDGLIERLRRADPARAAAPLTEEHRARLLAASVARRDAPKPVAPLRAHRHAPRRALLLACILALACAAAATAGVILSGQSGDQVRNDYVEVTRHVPLPPGYRWPGADAPDTADGAGVVYAGRNTALMQATLQANCAWWDAWLRAHARGDVAGMRAALAGHAEVIALTPRHRPGDSEDAGGADASLLAAERRLVADAHAGRTSAIRQRQAVNCTGPAAPRRLAP